MGSKARCEHCKGSGLADKEGPDDDELLSRVVLSAITIDGLREEIERLRKALERLGSMEAMTHSHWIPETPSGMELAARIEYAQKALAAFETERPK